MRLDISQYVKQCGTCERAKNENQPPDGLLQSLPVPSHIWEDISMEFLEGLPESSGKDIMLVVVDRFTKSGHFIALEHPILVVQLTQTFLYLVYRLHGLPKTITTDMDRLFVNKFWQELLKLIGTTLQFSSYYHPKQTDKQSN